MKLRINRGISYLVLAVSYLGMASGWGYAQNIASSDAVAGSDESSAWSSLYGRAVSSVANVGSLTGSKSAEPALQTSKSGKTLTPKEIADEAFAFYTKYPNSENAAAAVKIGLLAAIEGLGLGDASLVPLLSEKGGAYRKDKRYPISDRFQIALLMDSYFNKKSLTSRDDATRTAAKEQLLSGLDAEFGAISQVEDLYISYLLASKMQDSIRVANKLKTRKNSGALDDLLDTTSKRYSLIGTTPKVDIRDITGKSVSLQSSDGRPTVVYFWSISWAIGAFGKPSSVMAQFAGRVRWVFVSIGTNAEAHRLQLSDIPFGGISCAYAEGLSGPVAKRLFISHLPQVYVFDSKGILRGYGEVSELPTLVEMAK